MKQLFCAAVMLYAVLINVQIIKEGTSLWTHSPDPGLALLLVIFFGCVLPIGTMSMIWFKPQRTRKVRQLA